MVVRRIGVVAGCDAGRCWQCYLQRGLVVKFVIAGGVRCRWHWIGIWYIYQRHSGAAGGHGNSKSDIGVVIVVVVVIIIVVVVVIVIVTIVVNIVVVVVISIGAVISLAFLVSVNSSPERLVEANMAVACVQDATWRRRCQDALGGLAQVEGGDVVERRPQADR